MLVILTADKPTAKLEDVFVIDATVRNDGPDPVYLFTRLEWGPGGGMTLIIRNDAGEVLGGGDRILWPPPREDDPTLLVKLSPARFYGARRRLDVKDFMSRPGKYSLQLKYRVPNSRASLGDKLSGLHVLTHEEPTLYSNKLDFEVVP